MKLGWFPRGIVVAVLLILLILTLVPLFLLFFLSAKDNLDVLIDFWGIPAKIKWENYQLAFEAIKLSLCHSLFVCMVTIFGSLLFGSLTGYVMARHTFPGKQLIYIMLLGVMMIPGILTIVPLYSLIVMLKLDHTFWGLILPYVAGSQLLGILLCRTFFEGIPNELFEAARMDGGTELYLYRKIALPLSVSILITIGLVTFLSVYNDYLWPLLVLDQSQQTFTVAAVNLSSGGRQDIGLTFAAYVLGSIPTIILFSFGMKYYVNAMLNGAVKA
ncbi:carbohydrate ABC transporter permease [Cohnella endophytica]|uniref:Carbohydrate ABC transporter permease n=1 Tax=Cohnella endophytica TaxID=2419778 RepID=A0A494XTB6_9BACL|nr:carbohydrate ABC transporter permease [Cohnella endophytica]RKP52891.1 carbohydrate ABC transporter permease [Cohnella endophytica]